LGNKREIEVELPINIEDLPEVSNNPELLSKLKSWRKKVAEKENMPPYCIFHDTTLIKVSNILPTKKEDLTNIRGFGKKTIEKYGNDVLEIVRTHNSGDKNSSSEEVKGDKANSVEQIRYTHIRCTYPRAYMNWTEEEDIRLRNEYAQGKKISELTKIFQRKLNAIRSRLKKKGWIS